MGSIPEFKQGRISSAGNLPSSVTTSTIGSQAGVRGAIESNDNFELGTRVASDVTRVATQVFNRRQEIQDKAKKAKAMGQFALMSEKALHEHKLKNERNLTPESEQEFADKLKEIKDGLSGQFVTGSGKSDFEFSSQSAINRASMSHRRWSRQQGVENASNDLKDLAKIAGESAKSAGETNDKIALSDAIELVRENSDSYTAVVGDRDGGKVVDQIINGLNASYIGGRIENISEEDTAIGAQKKFLEAKHEIEKGVGGELDSEQSDALMRQANSVFMSKSKEIQRVEKLKSTNSWGYMAAKGLTEGLPSVDPSSPESITSRNEYIDNARKELNVTLDFYAPSEMTFIKESMKDKGVEDITSIMSGNFAQIPDDKKVAMAISIRDEDPAFASAILVADENPSASARVMQGAQIIKDKRQLMPELKMKDLSSMINKHLAVSMSSLDVESRKAVLASAEALAAVKIFQSGDPDSSKLEDVDIKAIIREILPTTEYKSRETATFYREKDGKSSPVGNSEFVDTLDNIPSFIAKGETEFRKITGSGLPRFSADGGRAPLTPDQLRQVDYRAVGDGVYHLYFNGARLETAGGESYEMDLKNNWGAINHASKVRDSDVAAKAAAGVRERQATLDKLVRPVDVTSVKSLRDIGKERGSKSVDAIRDVMEGAESNIKGASSFIDALQIGKVSKLITKKAHDFLEGE